MRRSFLLTCFVFVSLLEASAQREIVQDSIWSINDRFYTGIGFGGLSFGRSDYYGRYFSIGAGVLGGVMLTRDLSTGIGFEYQYTSFGDIKVKNHLYGGYPFVRYNIKNFFIQADYGIYNLRTDFRDQSANQTENRFFLGGGLFSTSNGRTFMNIMISYDLLYSSLSLFGSPLNTRIFFTF